MGKPKWYLSPSIATDRAPMTRRQLLAVIWLWWCLGDPKRRGWRRQFPPDGFDPRDKQFHLTKAILTAASDAVEAKREGTSPFAFSDKRQALRVSRAFATMPAVVGERLAESKQFFLKGKPFHNRILRALAFRYDLLHLLQQGAASVGAYLHPSELVVFDDLLGCDPPFQASPGHVFDVVVLGSHGTDAWIGVRSSPRKPVLPTIEAAQAGLPDFRDIGAWFAPEPTSVVAATPPTPRLSWLSARNVPQEPQLVEACIRRSARTLIGTACGVESSLPVRSLLSGSGVGVPGPIDVYQLPDDDALNGLVGELGRSVETARGTLLVVDASPVADLVRMVKLSLDRVENCPYEMIACLGRTALLSLLYNQPWVWTEAVGVSPGPSPDFQAVRGDDSDRLREVLLRGRLTELVPIDNDLIHTSIRSFVRRPAMRASIIGRAGSGKTTALYQLIRTHYADALILYLNCRLHLRDYRMVLEPVVRGWAELRPLVVVLDDLHLQSDVPTVETALAGVDSVLRILSLRDDRGDVSLLLSFRSELEMSVRACFSHHVSCSPPNWTELRLDDDEPFIGALVQRCQAAFGLLGTGTQTRDLPSHSSGQATALDVIRFFLCRYASAGVDGGGDSSQDSEVALDPLPFVEPSIVVEAASIPYDDFWWNSGLDAKLRDPVVVGEEMASFPRDLCRMTWDQLAMPTSEQFLLEFMQHVERFPLFAWRHLAGRPLDLFPDGSGMGSPSVVVGETYPRGCAAESMEQLVLRLDQVVPVAQTPRPVLLFLMASDTASLLRAAAFAVMRGRPDIGAIRILVLSPRSLAEYSSIFPALWSQFIGRHVHYPIDVLDSARADGFERTLRRLAVVMPLELDNAPLHPRLARLEGQGRVAIQGRTGSGKSVGALQLIRSWGSEGHVVLLAPNSDTDELRRAISGLLSLLQELPGETTVLLEDVHLEVHRSPERSSVSVLGEVLSRSQVRMVVTYWSPEHGRVAKQLGALFVRLGFGEAVTLDPLPRDHIRALVAWFAPSIRERTRREYVTWFFDEAATVHTIISVLAADRVGERQVRMKSGWMSDYWSLRLDALDEVGAGGGRRLLEGVAFLRGLGQACRVDHEVPLLGLGLLEMGGSEAERLVGRLVRSGWLLVDEGECLLDTSHMAALGFLGKGAYRSEMAKAVIVGIAVAENGMGGSQRESFAVRLLLQLLARGDRKAAHDLAATLANEAVRRRWNLSEMVGVVRIHLASGGDPGSEWMEMLHANGCDPKTVQEALRLLLLDGGVGVLAGFVRRWTTIVPAVAWQERLWQAMHGVPGIAKVIGSLEAGGYQVNFISWTDLAPYLSGWQDDWRRRRAGRKSHTFRSARVICGEVSEARLHLLFEDMLLLCEGAHTKRWMVLEYEHASRRIRRGNRLESEILRFIRRCVRLLESSGERGAAQAAKARLAVLVGM